MAARTWQQLPATDYADFHWVNDLELGVNDPRRIYAATRTGVWRSTDSGATWARLLAVNVRGGCLDLALRPDRREDVLFASCGSYEQATVYRFPRAADRSDAEVVLREPDMGRTSLAIAPSNPDVDLRARRQQRCRARRQLSPGAARRLSIGPRRRSPAPGRRGSRNAATDALNTLLLTNAARRIVARVCNPHATHASPTWAGTSTSSPSIRATRIASGPAGVDWFRSDDGGRNWGLASLGVGARPTVARARRSARASPSIRSTTATRNQIVIVGNDGGIYRTANARGAADAGTRPRAACRRSTSRCAGRRSIAATA